MTALIAERPDARAAATPIIDVRDLSRHFRVSRGFRKSGPQRVVRAVDGVSFAIARGETFSLVGESGCGKTTTARMLLLVEKPTGGDILFRGRNTRDFGRHDWREYRAATQAVFQDPWSSLNPRMRIDGIIAEPLQANRSVTRAERDARVRSLLNDVGLPASAARRFPHELSGGQRQRVAIARALSPDPELIVLDEPVSSLDVSIRAQIMNLLKDLQRQHGVSYLLIAHDLATVRYLAHRVAVMYLGRIVEDGPAAAMFDDAKHPYTKGLLSASLPARPGTRDDEVIVRGEVPSPLDPPSGCTFHPRCPFAMPRCSTEYPADRQVDGRLVACHLYE